MPRIRTIKPEFWDSPDTASAGLQARLLYIAMWNWADDYGIGDATPVRVIGFAFPRDEVPVADYPRIFAEVSRSFGTVFFEHCGRPYYAIPEWEKHQRTEKRAQPKPGLLEAAQEAMRLAITAGQGDYEKSPQNSSENPPPSSGFSGPGSRNRGKGTREQQIPPAPQADEPPPPDRPPKRRKTGVEIARSRFAGISARTQPAQQIAQAFSDTLTAPMESGMLAEVAVQVDKCLIAGILAPAICDGLQSWSFSESWHPSQIPKFVHKANIRNGQPAMTTNDRSMLDLAERGRRLAESAAAQQHPKEITDDS